MPDQYAQLLAYLRSLGSAAVAFSGGVDSALLLRAAKDALGEHTAAVTVRSCLFPAQELEEASAICRQLGVRHHIVTLDALAVDGFASNPPNRCYLCKTELFRCMRRTADALGLAHLVEGSNLDDCGDYRPGMAAVTEQGVLSPLRQVGLNKAGVRALAQQLALPVWNKPSLACLASRIAYGEQITEQKLRMIGEAEQYLRGLGFSQVRVRLHGSIARIELPPAEFTGILPLSGAIDTHLRTLGFQYAALDLRGYRTGSMNEIL
ncbi:MAG: ATP-dependent sacrificial sulfur transferase LarE [Agathobaculum sp.]|jgi:uncharacterized protein|uniref:ATP-dependent sacrificial sulfur transferase LarE n=1 Tax=Agathobaculum sp. TaxID=2048138 RepID=UPI003D8B8557